MKKGKIFRIGIAMAGAVSAGAYTAGVIDYLLETLQRWEEAKAANRLATAQGRLEDVDPTVPMHDVVIEVLGGASAGGMTAAITTLGLYADFAPIISLTEHAHENPLYQAWVDLNDQPKKDTLLQMLETDDIQGGKVASILNAKPIDAIGDRAVQMPTTRSPQSGDWPDYISKELELILTICSLHGIPVELNFGGVSVDEVVNSVPAHSMFMHKGLGHFTIDYEKGAAYDHLLGVKLDSRPNEPGQGDSTGDSTLDHREWVVQAAKASGAFPGGLKPRDILNVPREYIIAHIKRAFGNPDLNINWKRIPKFFSFTAVDGGTVNNEPFDDVTRVLEERYQEDIVSGLVDEEKEAKNYALIMIDPFPSFSVQETVEDGFKPVNTITEVATNVFGAVRHQAMIKEKQLSKGLSGDYTQSLVFPVRRSSNPKTGFQKEEYAIACASLNGFGGFFAREFREHDFALGRKNCQSFLRKHFSLTEGRPVVEYDTMIEEEAIKEGIFEDLNWGDPIYQRFHYVKDGIAHLPIIPDMRITKAASDDPTENGALAALPYPQIDISRLKKYRKPMRKRLHAILVAMAKNAFVKRGDSTPEEKAERKAVKKMVSKYLASSWMLRIGYVILILLFGPIIILAIPALIIGYQVLLYIMVRSIFQHIVYDFKKRGLLK